MSRDLLLAVNAGNTRTTFAVFDGAAIAHRFHLGTVPARTADELCAFLLPLMGARGLGAKDIRGVIVASVVPALDGALAAMTEGAFAREAVHAMRATRMPIRCEGVGEDRVCNAVAAYHEARARSIVVDLGTATTFDVVNDAGELLGGAIAPGLRISAEALSARTARLPSVEPERPSSPIGATTVTAMQSGIYWGYVALLEGLLERLSRAMGGHPRIFATGGLARLVAADVAAIEKVDEDLTLQGLRLIWEESRG